MRKALLLLVSILACSSSAPLLAQVEEVVVTGSRINSDEYSRMPAVVLERRADFLVRPIRLTNDTRSEEARTQEIYETLRDMVADSAKHAGFALGYGEHFLIPITATDYEVPLERGDRPDTSATTLYVKMALGEKDDVQKAIAEPDAFIKKVRLSGRTEVYMTGEVGLSLIKPEKYRYDIIAKITQDAKRLQSATALQCKVEISGLSNRVSWRRSDVSLLTLYIPYEIQLTGCQ
jgi:hypothetical protein